MEQPARLAISGAVGGCCFSRRRSRYALMSACLVRSLRRRRPSFWRCLGSDRSICCSMLDVGTRWLIEANALGHLLAVSTPPDRPPPVPARITPKFPISASTAVLFRICSASAELAASKTSKPAAVRCPAVIDRKTAFSSRTKTTGLSAISTGAPTPSDPSQTLPEAFLDLWLLLHWNLHSD